MRKLRFALPHKGKSGGARIIYIDFVHYEKIYLITVYAKNELEDLTHADRNDLKILKSIKQGLSEAIEFERGNLPNVRVDKITVSPLRSYSGSKIKSIRQHHNMTQRLFAEALGVSPKTVEAWESEKNIPSGCASRMLELLDQDGELFEKYSIVARR
jgi:putative transcriptional regulator